MQFPSFLLLIINASVSSQSHSDPQEALKMAARRLLMLLACLAAVALLPARAAEDDPGCADGWSKFGSRCFKFFNVKKTWTDAEKSCHEHCANLPSIHSLEEHNFIVNLIKTASGGDTRTWLGGSDAVQEGSWLWSDGTRWDYSRWYPNQPDNAGGEHCAAYWTGAKLGCPPMNPPPAGGSVRSRCKEIWAAVTGRGLDDGSQDMKTLGTWNVTSLGGRTWSLCWRLSVTN
ncbi:galactose-specific lectin nattectin-like [Boleophthalmus pectinirostris]|uniref:galactose-specific lectin nattectin-like n=1 Tax=Boleophthalmus pectinirostris TaxID=150288 RepID=UPI00242B2573|nr:galactose-specific lectin nattectin-like [Boleophthalmus pectinirostris]